MSRPGGLAARRAMLALPVLPDPLSPPARPRAQQGQVPRVRGPLHGHGRPHLLRPPGRRRHRARRCAGRHDRQPHRHGLQRHAHGLRSGQGLPVPGGGSATWERAGWGQLEREVYVCLGPRALTTPPRAHDRMSCMGWRAGRWARARGRTWRGRGRAAARGRCPPTWLTTTAWRGTSGRSGCCCASTSRSRRPRWVGRAAGTGSQGRAVAVREAEVQLNPCHGVAGPAGEHECRRARSSLSLVLGCRWHFVFGTKVAVSRASLFGRRCCGPGPGVAAQRDLGALTTRTAAGRVGDRGQVRRGHPRGGLQVGAQRCATPCRLGLGIGPGAHAAAHTCVSAPSHPQRSLRNPHIKSMAGCGRFHAAARVVCTERVHVPLALPGWPSTAGWCAWWTPPSPTSCRGCGCSR